PRDTVPFPVASLDLADADAVKTELASQDAVLSCLPFQLNTALAQTAHDAGIHYFDLTEDVPTTKAIIDMAETAKGLMAPQCGLAPGFIGIVGANLISQFDECRSCKMRVGALPQNPTGLMGYAFNWSPEGVVNEYLNDCEVIEEGTRKWVSAMEWVEDIYIDGVRLEAFTTSGGLGTMCDTYLGKVANIDYKTMRYPGHVRQMNFFFHELLMRDHRQQAGEILVKAKPPVQDDVVYVHAAAEGHINGRLERREFVRAYRPIEVAGHQRTAIAWTTAGSVVAIIEMVRDGKLPGKGFLKQEDIPLDDFLAMPTGSLYAV
ncbi:MAG: saccharopine dehydrogenase C-terminal domain-containing protein, partial [Pseudomonadota bacterium]